MSIGLYRMVNTKKIQALNETKSWNVCKVSLQIISYMMLHLSNVSLVQYLVGNELNIISIIESIFFVKLTA